MQIQTNEQKFNLQMLEDIIQKEFSSIKNDKKMFQIWDYMETYLFNEKDGYFDQLIKNPNMWEGFMQIIFKKLNEKYYNNKNESFMITTKVRLLYSLYARQSKNNGLYESNKYYHLLKSFADFLRQKSSNEEDIKLSIPHVILSSMHLKFKNDILEGRNIENDFISDAAFYLKALQKSHQLDNFSLLTEEMQISAAFGMIFDKQQWKKPIDWLINFKDDDLRSIYKFNTLMNLFLMSCIFNKDLSLFDQLINKILRRENLFYPSVIIFHFQPHTIQIYLQRFSEKKYLTQLFNNFLKLKTELDQRSIELLKAHMKKLDVTFSETEIKDK